MHTFRVLQRTTGAGMTEMPGTGRFDQLLQPVDAMSRVIGKQESPTTMLKTVCRLTGRGPLLVTGTTSTADTEQTITLQSTAAREVTTRATFHDLRRHRPLLSQTIQWRRPSLRFPPHNSLQHLQHHSHTHCSFQNLLPELSQAISQT
jgi:hypothetical protein